MKNKGNKFSALIVFIVTLLFSLSGCKSCIREQWQQVYDVYSQEEGKFYYQTFNATITLETFSDIKSRFKILIDSEEYLEKYQDEPNAKASIEIYQRLRFYFVDESIKILENAGFFDDINEDTIFTFTVNNYIGWDGWAYPVFGVAINGKTYLDFETGHKNVLDYVQEEINNI